MLRFVVVVGFFCCFVGPLVLLGSSSYCFVIDPLLTNHQPQNQHHQQLQIGYGYDHSYVLDLPSSSPPPSFPLSPLGQTTTSNEVKHVAMVKAEKEKGEKGEERGSGIQMDVWTDQPAVQLYTGIL